MRLGAPVFGVDKKDPEAWALAHRKLGYGAAYCPVNADADESTCRAYADAARRQNVVIAEVGAWSNPISPDTEQARKAVEYCIGQLQLAERIGAHCCVNIAGSRNPEHWDGPHPENLLPATFDLIVQTVRQIIDAVKPKRTSYSLETMPWIFPHSADSYLQLIKAIDRKACMVHLDPVNIVNCPERMYDTTSLLRECFEKLGPWMLSCHAKDIRYTNSLTLHLEETLPGTGVLDYRTFLTLAEKCNPEMPIMLEHLSKPEEFAAAAKHVRQVADELKIRCI